MFKEVNKNILFVTISICITIIIGLFVVNNNKNMDSGDLIEELNDTIQKEYGVTAQINLSFHKLSENQSETLAKEFSDALKSDYTLESYKGSEWYDIENDNISVSFFRE